MTDVKTAMVMAAGLGKRMRPLTESLPKPLVEVAGKPMIDHCFDKLSDAGVETVIVNVHYLADQLEAHLAQSRYGFDFRISDERAQLMETGGGLIQAAPLIDAECFYCLNSDNLWSDAGENSLIRLADNWVEDDMDALLLLVPTQAASNYSGQGDFHLDGSGRISRKQAGQRAPFLYSGIQLVSKRLLANAPDGPFSTNQLWDQAIRKGRLFGLEHLGAWYEVGAPEAIAPTEAALASV